MSIISAILWIGCDNDNDQNPSSPSSVGSSGEATSAAGTTGSPADFSSGSGGNAGGFDATSGIEIGFDSGVADGTIATSGEDLIFDSGTQDGRSATSRLDASSGDRTNSQDGATSGLDASGGNAAPDSNVAIVGANPVPSEGCGADSPLSGSFTIDVQGTAREYLVKVPDNYDSNTPYRLIFVWHGLFGTASTSSFGLLGLEAYADGSAIFIAGQAVGNDRGWAIHPDNSDIDFTNAMLDWTMTNYCIDINRVFSIGMSRGGMMSNSVGCELGDVFRAIAVVAGGGPQGYATTPCKGQVAVWITHGNQDNNVPFSYGVQSRDYWVSANHCGSETLTATPSGCVEYVGCDEGYPVLFCEHDGGHMVPSFTGEAAWNFFARF